MHYAWRSTRITLSPLILMACMAFAPARAGEDLLLLAPGQPSPAEEKPPYSVNVVKLTLPPLNHPERGIHIKQDAYFAAPMPGPDMVEPENAVAVLPPLEILTDIPGCVTPEVVAVDKRHAAYDATTYSGRNDALRDLPGFAAFPVIDLPVAATGISPDLPAMPVRGAGVETLEPFVPASEGRKPPPEHVRLPLPLESERAKALARLPVLGGGGVSAGVGSGAGVVDAAGGAGSEAFTLRPPPESVMRLTGSAPRVSGSPLLSVPPGVALTASVGSSPYGVAAGGGGAGLTGSVPVAERGQVVERGEVAGRGVRRPAPSLAERNVPTVAVREGGGFTPVRGIKNLLGQ